MTPAPPVEQQIRDLEKQIIDELHTFAASMETAIGPWLQEWENEGWLGAVTTLFDGLLKGAEIWWEGEGEFWDSVWDWLASLPDAAAIHQISADYKTGQ